MRIIKTAIIAAAILSVIGSMFSCGDNSDSVIAAGSTSVQPYAEILAEKYMLLYPGSVIDVQGGGSSAGIEAAETGTADIGMSSRALTDDENGRLWSVEIAKDGLAVIVNPKNPVKNLTLEQVRDIYANKITDWSEVGGNNAKIHVITREEGSGTRSAFTDLIMDKQQITPKAIVQDSNGAVRQLVSSDPNSIGFISLGLVDKTIVKAVELNGIEATAANVINGTYNFSRPFLFVSKGEPEGIAKQFIDFTLSPEGQQMLVNEGLISVAPDMSDTSIAPNIETEGNK